MAFQQGWTGVQLDGSTSALTTGSLTTTSGNTIVVGTSSAVDNTDPANGSVTDNKGNSYSKVNSQTNGSGDRIALWYCKNIIGGTSHTITFTKSSSNYKVVCAVELSSIDGTLDVTTKNTGTGVSPMSSGAIVTNVNDDLIGYFTMSSVSNAAWSTSGTSIIRSSFGNAGIGTIGGLYTRDNVAAASNSMAGNYNNETGNYSGIFASFKVSSGGVLYPQLERGMRGFNRGIGLGMYKMEPKKWWDTGWILKRKRKRTDELELILNRK